MHGEGDHDRLRRRRTRGAALLLAAVLSGCVTKRTLSWHDFTVEPADATKNSASLGLFEAYRGTWIVANAQDAPSRPRVLQQDGKAAKDDFNVALMSGLSVDE